MRTSPLPSRAHRPHSPLLSARRSTTTAASQGDQQDNETVAPGLAALSKLLIERTGYPRRGALAEFTRASQIPGPTLGRYIRGEMRPTEATLRKLAPALGLTFADLWQILNPNPDEGTAPPPDPNKLHRLSTLLRDAQQIIIELLLEQVPSTIARERPDP
jgi:transcriptional regulator with XRE-family HTH domain